MNQLKVAFHVHTKYSKDSSLKPEKLLELCERYLIDVLVVTDHNNMNGFKAVKNLADERKLKLTIIPAEEIATSDGEVIGLFLKTEIPKGLKFKETLDEIKKQGGLTCLPHPFDTVRRERIKDAQLIIDNIKDIDIIEVFNSRNLKSQDNLKALELAQKFSKPKIWGSDTHFGYEFKNCFFKMPDFNNDSRRFLDMLKLGNMCVTKKSIIGFFQSLLRKYLLFPKF